MINVEIGEDFRPFVGNQASLDIEADSVRQLVDEIDRRYPGFKKEVLTLEGEIKTYIWFWVEVAPTAELKYDRYEVAEDINTTLPDHTKVMIDFALPA